MIRKLGNKLLIKVFNLKITLKNYLSKEMPIKNRLIHKMMLLSIKSAPRITKPWPSLTASSTRAYVDGIARVAATRNNTATTVTSTVRRRR